MLSSSAQADDPVGTESSVITGCPSSRGMTASDLRRYITFFARPQVLIADQMPRSSRKRSIGADDLMEAMR